MTIKDYCDLIEKGKEIRNIIQGKTTASECKKTDNFDISGYTLEDIHDFIRVATNIIEHLEVN